MPLFVFPNNPNFTQSFKLTCFKHFLRAIKYVVKWPLTSSSYHLFITNISVNLVILVSLQNMADFAEMIKSIPPIHQVVVISF